MACVSNPRPLATLAKGSDAKLSLTWKRHKFYKVRGHHPRRVTKTDVCVRCGKKKENVDSNV